MKSGFAARPYRTWTSTWTQPLTVFKLVRCAIVGGRAVDGRARGNQFQLQSEALALVLSIPANDHSVLIVVGHSVGDTLQLEFEDACHRDLHCGDCHERRPDGTAKHPQSGQGRATHPAHRGFPVPMLWVTLLVEHMWLWHPILRQLSRLEDEPGHSAIWVDVLRVAALRRGRPAEQGQE